MGVIRRNQIRLVLNRIGVKFGGLNATLKVVASTRFRPSYEEVVIRSDSGVKARVEVIVGDS